MNLLRQANNLNSDTTRIKALSDGVFAIALTLLVLGIHVPQPSELGAGSLWQALIGQWQSYVGFVLSFLLVGMVWANHHTMFSYIKRVNHVFILINLLLLLDIAFLPFPTYLLSLYIGHPVSQQVAVMVYSATLAVGGIFYNLVWLYGLRAGLVDSGEKESLKKLGRRYLLGPFLYTAAFLLSFFADGGLGLLVCAFMAVFFYIPAIAERI